MKLHSFDICQPCNQLYQLYSPRCLLRSGDQIELALWRNGVFVLASDQLLSTHIQTYVSILLRKKKSLLYNNYVHFHTKNHLTRYLRKGADNSNVRFLSSVALRTKQWQIFSHFPDILHVTMWTNLNFLEYDQNEHE